MSLSTEIAAATPGHFWGGFAGAGILVVGAAWYALRALARKRLIEDTPTSRLRSAAQGYVELQGVAQLLDGEPIHAPLTGRPCAWFRYRIERRERVTDQRGRSRTEWRTVERGTSDGLFMLRDDTGSCVVDPDGATVTPSARQLWYGGSATAPPAVEPGRVARWSGLAALGQTYRYTEERLDPGTPVYALGHFETHGGGGAHRQLSDDVTALLRTWKRDRAALLRRFDADHNGDIDTAEWEVARRAAYAEAQAQAQSRPLPPAVDLLCATGDGTRPFVISAVSESDLIRRTALLAFGCSAVACSGTALLIWMALQRLAQ